jgi:hypothetical protein
MRHEVKFGLLNARSVADKKKANVIADFIRENDHDVIALTET